MKRVCGGFQSVPPNENTFFSSSASFCVISATNGEIKSKAFRQTSCIKIRLGNWGNVPPGEPDVQLKKTSDTTGSKEKRSEPPLLSLCAARIQYNTWKHLEMIRDLTGNKHAAWSGTPL